jgi:hypothetical protein
LRPAGPPNGARAQLPAPPTGSERCARVRRQKLTRIDWTSLWPRRLPPCSAASRLGFAIGNVALGVAWQLVVDLIPRSLLGYPDMNERPPFGIGIQRPEADAPDVGLTSATTENGRSAARAECPKPSGGRLVLGEQLLARKKLEVLRAGGRIRRECGPRSLPALHTVTEPRGSELPRNAEPNTAAETTTLEHADPLPPPNGHAVRLHPTALTANAAALRTPPGC